MKEEEGVQTPPETWHTSLLSYPHFRSKSPTFYQCFKSRHGLPVPMAHPLSHGSTNEHMVITVDRCGPSVFAGPSAMNKTEATAQHWAPPGEDPMRPIKRPVTTKRFGGKPSNVNYALP